MSRQLKTVSLSAVSSLLVASDQWADLVPASSAAWVGALPNDADEIQRMSQSEVPTQGPLGRGCASAVGCWANVVAIGRLNGGVCPRLPLHQQLAVNNL